MRMNINDTISIIERMWNAMKRAPVFAATPGGAWFGRSAR